MDLNDLSVDELIDYCVDTTAKLPYEHRQGFVKMCMDNFMTNKNPVSMLVVREFESRLIAAGVIQKVSVSS